VPARHEHRDFDHLAPREDRSGNLWYIRRPYEKTAGEVAFSAGKDAIMFPWRVAKGVFGFLDAFSKIYGGLVPASWELVCRNRKGQDYVAARQSWRSTLARTTASSTATASRASDWSTATGRRWRAPTSSRTSASER
jgi:hypothetical protein